MFTLSDCITRINQILNYPAYTYTDISHFFDQAISELNTSFKINIPLVSQMIDENRINVYEQPNLVVLETEPSSTVADIPTGTSVDEFTDLKKAYYNPTDFKFYKFDYKTSTWVSYDKVYGIYIGENGVRTLYQTVPLPTAGYAIWTHYVEDITSLDLNKYLPNDWIILFLIPYTCFKTAVRDGNTGDLYSEEFTQGFQQLQTSYDVPNYTNLASVAHLPAYTPVVQENLSNLNTNIATRAVYDSMKIGNAILPVYEGFNTRGGWGF